ncbi:MAG: hypothetical protein LBS05_11425 [Tannerellaceae bacterium]|nr:hypothetical protein [Tannerellaceae bacterium]
MIKSSPFADADDLAHLEFSQCDLRHTTFAVRTPLILDFREEDRRQRLCFVLCWLNTHNQKGPYSPPPSYTASLPEEGKMVFDNAPGRCIDRAQVFDDTAPQDQDQPGEYFIEALQILA